MQSVVLVATDDMRKNRLGEPVPMPLVDVEGQPYLTTLLNRLVAVPGLEAVHVIINETFRALVEDWHARLPSLPVAVTVLSDESPKYKPPLGAIGDLRLAIKQHGLNDDLVIVGGDNWFSYDLVDFVSKARSHSPAVVVTRVAPGARPSRFGWVELEEGGRIVGFREHPQVEPGSGAWKASCVYYLSRTDLHWLDRFAGDQSTVCSPGTFFAWLAERTPVYGIPEVAFIGGPGAEKTHPLKGPDHLEWRDSLRTEANPVYSTWERDAKRLEEASSHGELVIALRSDPSPNVRIVAARLLGQARDLLSGPARQAVTEALVQALNDPAQNDIGSSSFEDDENSVYYVAATAAESLVALGYAPDVAAVFTTAAAAGRPVHECRNNP